MNTPSSEGDGPTITAIVFTKDPFWRKFGVDGPTQVIATLSDGSESHVFTYYDDELTFTDDELVGQTVEGARALFYEKDMEYLRS